ncbi:ATP-binding protein [Streptomyces chumphonensis]|uniref:ATP-binding protein n=1 Tax=Streptomyces chumphonensis TaxID=1214925 RepID=A0A927F369_9ACTN|nr:ATP-binding protein [Streptomyces chumphonensis]MBD3934698.1 ATP-binding protein [Streptomyces chumphonensis]
MDQPGLAPPAPVVLRWDRDPRNVSKARAGLRVTPATWGLTAIEEEASLVLSELMTNAVRHAHAPGRQIETRYVFVPDGLRVEVHDACDVRPVRELTTGGATGGWGLPLVDVLAARWGVSDRQGPGKVVWAELRAS